MKLTKDNFRKELGELQESLNRLPHVDIDLVDSSISRLKEKVSEIKTNAETLLANNCVLRLGVVGQVKAGKSSFLNSLIFDGEDVLPKAATPMTAGLTVIEYGKENEFEIEFYDASEWAFFEDRAKEYDSIIDANRGAYPDATDDDIAVMAGIPDELKAAKELVSDASGKAKSCIKQHTENRKEKFSGQKDLHGKLAQYVGADGAYTPVVKALTIRMADERLKDLQVVDTPGVNDPIISREERTRQFLSGCHGVFFLSYSGSFFDATDVNFLVNRIGGQGIGDIVVIASKFDSALQDVGHQFHDDLAGAAEHLEDVLRKQMDRNIGASDYRGKAPTFDFSSGIGFSIAKKGESRWDPTERNVVEQMQRFYPSFFSTQEDIKETFLNLAQISDIQEKYLKDFARNKDRIICSKMNSYFANITGEINEYAKDAIGKGNNALKTIQESTASTLEKTRSETDNLLRSLSGDINRLIANSQSEIDLITREIENSCRLPGNLSIDKKCNNIHCSRETTFWGRTSTFCVQVECVDSHETIKKVRKSWENLIDDTVKLWDKRLEKISSGLLASINNVIESAEGDDSERVIDADLMRDIIKDAMQQLKDFKMPNVAELKNIPDKLNFQNVVSFNKYAGCMEEDDARDKIRERAQSNLSSATTILTAFKNNANQELAKVFKNQATEAKKVLTQKQKSLISEVSEKINSYLRELEEKIKNKQQEEQKIQDFCIALKNINQKILS